MGQCLADEHQVPCLVCGKQPCLFYQGISDCLKLVDAWAEEQGAKHDEGLFPPNKQVSPQGIGILLQVDPWVFGKGSEGGA